MRNYGNSRAFQSLTCVHSLMAQPNLHVSKNTTLNVDPDHTLFARGARCYGDCFAKALDLEKLERATIQNSQRWHNLHDLAAPGVSLRQAIQFELAVKKVIAMNINVKGQTHLNPSEANEGIVGEVGVVDVAVAGSLMIISAQLLQI